jgi:hypothetical protein
MKASILCNIIGSIFARTKTLSSERGRRRRILGREVNVSPETYSKQEPFLPDDEWLRDVLARRHGDGAIDQRHLKPEAVSEPESGFPCPWVSGLVFVVAQLLAFSLQPWYHKGKPKESVTFLPALTTQPV